jgi:hypothetical protein
MREKRSRLELFVGLSLGALLATGGTILAGIGIDEALDYYMGNREALDYSLCHLKFSAISYLASALSFFS